MNETSLLMKRRFIELSERSYEKGICLFSDFLDDASLTDFYEIKKELSPCGIRMYGGFSDAERMMIGFGTEEVLGYEEPFPIAFLLVKPRAPKFSEDLSHRDFLGALMNLGIERGKTGDIIVKDNKCLIICEESLCDFIISELSRVRHTEVVCEREECFNEEFLPKRERTDSVISSLRLDALVAKAANLSRGNAAELISSGKVLINGRETKDVSLVPKEGDRISIRGFGKIRFVEAAGETKKGRLRVSWERYV